MELYIEKEFLDDFYVDYGDNPIQKIVKEIFIRYGEKIVFINFNEENFEKLDAENEYFASISNIIPPTPINSIKEHLFSNSDFKQTLVFTKKEEGWFKKAEHKGALCFSFENYQEKIKEIIDKLHFKIDLNDDFLGWDFLKNFKKLNFNSIVISDNYILGHEKENGIKDNIVSLLQKMIYNEEREINIKIFTKELKPLAQTQESKKEKANKRLKILNRTFANYKTKFSIILNDYKPFEYRFHDRYITTNFSLMDSGVGFNLMPYKKSDSQIISETIFDKYTYKRLNNIKKIQAKYIQKIQNLETSKFKMFPDKK